MSNPEIDAIRALLQSRPRPTDLAERRQRLDGLGAGYTLPPDVHFEPVSAGGVPAEWTSTPAADPSRVILFLHGGAYIAGSIRSHRHMIAEAGRQAHARTLALDYRLAPEHPFPAAPHDALAAYRFLLSSGFDPANIALAGESAGGGLALATLISLRDENTPLPAHVWLSSPWTDLTMTGETMTTKAAVDPLIQRALPAGNRRALSERHRSDEPARLSNQRRPARTAAHADPDRHGRDAAQRLDPACCCCSSSRCPRHPPGLAGHDPCLAPVSSSTRRWAGRAG